MAAAARTRSHARRASAPPRRVSGPVRGATAAAAPPPLALRLGGALHGIAEHRLLDRIIRGRAWIGILAVGLIGIVFMQVSMLRMNAGIGRDVEQAAQLERQNAAMRAALSELTSGDRIEAQAAKLGYVLPPAGAARFLDVRRFDPARAVANIQPPSHLAALPVGTASTMAAAAETLPATGVAPSAQTAVAAAPATTATTATTTTTTPAAAAPPAATTTPAPPPPTGTAASSGGATTTATPATTGGAAPAPAG